MELSRDRVDCHCPPAYYGTRCHIPMQTKERQHEVDNTAITSMTVTIVSVSIVAVVLTAGIIYLIVVMTRRRRLTSPFKHRRMGESRGGPRAGMEFANRMFLQDDDDIPEDDNAFTMEQIIPSTNFVNPVYETMFQDTSRTPIIRHSANLLVHAVSSGSPSPTPQEEQTGLLRGDQEAPVGRAVIHTDSD